MDNGEAVPAFRRQYRLAAALEHYVNAQVKKWLANGVIAFAPAGCKKNSPLIAVRNSTQRVRICLDPRLVNSLLRSGDNFPIPIISDLVERFAGGKIFSSLDLKAGYNQFTIHEPDRPKLSFTWNGRQYMFVGAPFGVTPLLSAFQRVLSSIFADLPHFVVYIDNIYAISVTLEEHSVPLVVVLERLNL